MRPSVTHARAFARLSRENVRARALAADLVAQLVELVDNEEAWTLASDAPVVELALVSYQYAENYGYCEGRDYWKFKGGADVVVAIPEGWTLGDVVEALAPRYEWDSRASRQYVLGANRISQRELEADELLQELADWVPACALLAA